MSYLNWSITVALLTLLAILSEGEQISPIVATNVANSANANVLVDGAYSLGSSDRWENSGNQWQPSGYAWIGQLDLLQSYTLATLQYYSDIIPFTSTAKLTIEGSNNGQSYSTIASATNPSYNGWNTVVLSGTFRYLRVRFNAVNEHFYITEIRVFSQNTGGEQISPIVATNVANSANANVLVDGAYSLGSSDRWENSGNQWQPSGYAWIGQLDLLQSYTLSSLNYYSDAIPFTSTAKLTIEGSNNGQSYSTIASATNPSYNGWNTVVLSGTFRYLRVRFNAVNEHFYITEIRVFN